MSATRFLDKDYSISGLWWISLAFLKVNQIFCIWIIFDIILVMHCGFLNFGMLVHRFTRCLERVFYQIFLYLGNFRYEWGHAMSGFKFWVVWGFELACILTEITHIQKNFLLENCPFMKSYKNLHKFHLTFFLQKPTKELSKPRKNIWNWNTCTRWVMSICHFNAVAGQLYEQDL